MQKRGMAQSAIVFLIAAMVVLAVGAFGMRAVFGIKEKICQTELEEFRLQFQGKDRQVRLGDIKEETIPIPCDAERVFIMDRNTLPLADWFSQYPLMQDSLEDKTGENVFVIKGDEIKASFDAGEIGVRYPYFSCMVPLSGKLSYYLEGKGKEVGFIPGCNQPVCLYPEKFDEAAQRRALNDAASQNAACSQEDITTQVEKMRRLYENFNIYRGYSYCEGKTKVHLRIAPKENVVAQGVTLTDVIPKNCIENLDETLTQFQGPLDSQERIIADPMIMWEFSSLGEGKEMFYEVDLTLNNNCAKEIVATGCYQSLRKNSVEVPIFSGAPQVQEEPQVIIVPNSDEEGDDTLEPVVCNRSVQKVCEEDQSKMKVDDGCGRKRTLYCWGGCENGECKEGIKTNFNNLPQNIKDALPRTAAVELQKRAAQNQQGTSTI